MIIRVQLGCGNSVIKNICPFIPVYIGASFQFPPPWPPQGRRPGLTPSGRSQPSSSVLHQFCGPMRTSQGLLRSASAGGRRTHRLAQMRPVVPPSLVCVSLSLEICKIGPLDIPAGLPAVQILESSLPRKSHWAS